MLKLTGWRVYRLRRKIFLVRPIQHDHGACTQHWLIYVSPIYCACTTAWSSASGGTCLAEPVSASGLPLVVPADVRHHVVRTHTAQMVLFAQAICILAQVVQTWAVIILRNACIYMRSDLKSRSGPLTRRSVTWIVLLSPYIFFFTFGLRRGALS